MGPPRSTLVKRPLQGLLPPGQALLQGAESLLGLQGLAQEGQEGLLQKAVGKKLLELRGHPLLQGLVQVLGEPEGAFHLVQNAEGRMNPGFLGVLLADASRQAVQGPDGGGFHLVHPLGRHLALEHPAHPGPEFPGGLLCKGHGHDLQGGKPLMLHQPEVAVGHEVGFARPRPGLHRHRTVVLHRCPLFRVQAHTFSFRAKWAPWRHRALKPQLQQAFWLQSGGKAVWKKLPGLTSEAWSSRGSP